MSLWDGVEIIDHEGNKHSATEVLKDKVVALYFSAGKFKNSHLDTLTGIFRLVSSLPCFHSKAEEILWNP